MRQTASLTIRKLDPRLKQELRLRAAANGRSMEEEARAILRASLGTHPLTGQQFVDNVRRRFADAGYVDLKARTDEPARPLPDFK